MPLRIEKGEFLFQRQPLAILGDEHGRVRAVRVTETALVDSGDGRPRPQNMAGTEYEIAADVVIQSFGFLPSPPDWLVSHGVKLAPSGRVITGANGALPLQTSHPRIFAGGDNVRGADLVVRAVYDGREAAVSIAQLLRDPSAVTVREVEQHALPAVAAL